MWSWLENERLVGSLREGRGPFEAHQDMQRGLHVIEYVRVNHTIHFGMIKSCSTNNVIVPRQQ